MQIGGQGIYKKGGQKSIKKVLNKIRITKEESRSKVVRKSEGIMMKVGRKIPIKNRARNLGKTGGVSINKDEQA